MGQRLAAAPFGSPEILWKLLQSSDSGYCHCTRAKTGLLETMTSVSRCCCRHRKESRLISQIYPSWKRGTVARKSRTCSCLYGRIYLSMSVHMHIYKPPHTPTHIYVCTHLYRYMWKDIYVCVYVYVHTHVYIYIYKYM